MTDSARPTSRLALILVSIALVFFVGFVAKMRAVRR